MTNCTPLERHSVIPGCRVSRRAPAAVFTVSLLALAAMLPVAPDSARADTVGVGDLDFEFIGLTEDFDGTVAWDDQAYLVDAVSVNLGTSVGTNTIVGTVSNFSAGTFATTVAGSAALSYDYDGNFDCSAGPCAFVGLATSMAGTLMGGTLPATTGYFADGSVDCSSFPVCTGRISLNYSAPQPTPTGTDVAVAGQTTFFNPISNAEQTLDLELTFDNVTGAGDTSLIPVSAVTGNLPAQFSINVGGWNGILFDVSTTAAFTGNVELCTSWDDANDDGIIDGTTIPETALTFLHNESGTFVDVTSSFFADTNTICGSVTSFSEFGVFLIEGLLPICEEAPRSGCDTVNSAKVQFNDKKPGKEKAKVQLKRNTNPILTQFWGSLTDSFSGEAVGLCVYDDSDELVAEMRINAGGLCEGKPCFTLKTGKSFNYKSKAGAQAGVNKMTLGAGSPGKAKVSLGAKNNEPKGLTGLQTGIPTLLAGSGNPTIQVVTNKQFCVEAVLNVVKKDTGTTYQAQR